MGYNGERMMSASPTRLALFVPSMRGGGAERVTLTLAQEIVKRGYAVDLLLAQAEGPHLAEVPKAVRLIDLNATRMMGSLPTLIRYLRRERPQAMLSMMVHTNIVALWARWLARVSTRLVVSERVTVSWRLQHATIKRNWLWPRLIKRFYPWADSIVAPSKGVADELVQLTGIAREHVQVIYNPVVRPELQKRIQAPLDHPWFEAGQPPVVLAVGRLTPQKDFPTLIRAFAKVRQTRPARLLILGEGEERSALEALIQKVNLTDEVQLPGFAENPYAYMSRASLFVLSSRWEGLPGVLIEALYSGTRLIATDCPSGPQEILKGGEYGQLVPIGDVAVLAEAMEMALAAKKPQLPPESWRPFALDTVVNQYLTALLDD